MSDPKARGNETPAGALVAPKTATSGDRFGVLSRSTLLRHTIIAVVGFGIVLLIIQALDDATNATELAPIAITTCAAAGLTLLVGLSGQISLGNGAFMFVGAYTTARRMGPAAHSRGSQGYGT